MAFDTPAGSITTTNQDLIVRATADVTTPEEFEDIIIGGTTRIGDVATVTLGPDIGRTSLRSDGKTGIGIGIIRAGAIQHAGHFRRRHGGGRRHCRRTCPRA